MLTDSHCHLGSHKFSEDELPALLARASDAGVQRLITLATNLEDMPANLALAEQFDQVYACVGIHPCDVQDTPNDYLDALRTFARHPRTAAIGETGLDYYHPAPEGWTDQDYHQRQRDFLRPHFELAPELGLNLVLHPRDRKGEASFSDALEIYRPFSEQVHAVFHCFPGPAAQADRVLALGGLVSFAGIATFKNAAVVHKAVADCPAGRFMVASASPYLAPVPFRGQRCEPAYVRQTAEHLATIRSQSLADLAQMTEETVEGFFRLEK